MSWIWFSAIIKLQKSFRWHLSSTSRCATYQERKYRPDWVMGLAILPPRLKAELAEVEKYLLGPRKSCCYHHQLWAENLKTIILM